MTDSSDPDRTAGGFDDPTAPTWTGPDAATPAEPGMPSDATQPVGPAGPTQPIPAATPAATPTAPPAEPYGSAPFGQNPYAATPYPQHPASPAPYGTSAYGQAGYDQAPYSQAPYGQLEPTPYALPPGPYAAPRANGNALALTIVSAIATVLCCLLCLPSLILGIVALSKQSTDPQGSAKLARWGWYALAAGAVLAVLAIGAFIALGVAGAFDSSSYEYQGA